MNELTDPLDELLAPVGVVVETMLSHARDLQPSEIMVVGAACRDLHHRALGHGFAATATYDLDLALALPSWDAFHALAAAFPTVGNTGIRFLIADVTVDLVPFGTIEDPEGVAQPPTRRESLSVWAFSEIFASALPLLLPTGATVKLPTVAGYAAAKLGAWLDRSEWFEGKDAADLALVLYWYGDTASVHDRLYGTAEGQDISAPSQLTCCWQLVGCWVTTLRRRSAPSGCPSCWIGGPATLNSSYKTSASLEHPGQPTRGAVGQSSMP